ncbi:lysostaphin resistance A-like protein [Formosa undariae]|uniref:Lysostaphin resistance A-like protein n=1 Tax=Formosa undariae TaxID=1325436 RepID=A0ABV5F2D2_9FLAO
MTVLKAILLTLFLILVFTITQLAFGLLVYKTELVSESYQIHYGITIGLSFIIGYLVTFRIFWKPSFRINKSLNLKKIDFKLIPYLILIVIGLQLLDRPFWDLERIWNFINYSEFQADISSFGGFRPALLYNTITILIISPIFEELFFRKFLLQNLLQKNSKLIGILFSSLCFAIIHIETPLNLVPTFIFGIISGLIFIKTNRIIYSIILHFLVNLMVQILYVFNLTFDRWLLTLDFNFIYWLMFLIGIGITYFTTKKLPATKYCGKKQVKTH